MDPASILTAGAAFLAALGVVRLLRGRRTASRTDVAFGCMFIGTAGMALAISLHGSVPVAAFMTMLLVSGATLMWASRALGEEARKREHAHLRGWARRMRDQ
ncbi:hypothetical protein DOU17_01250 [Clavibacter michiganensis subsp. michiganensis]|uniref:hypothetical protein n=1 Tax=Clavibacter michiganensis TaxID=28447 RepID=UPI000B6EBD68|nr:hypothetical protein [Clavibacter michiganensis]MWJ17570.1 hypothetical protein [Clavibacter michiganensis subsp. michiganensis]OUE00171.1 hypothetical protein CMMCAS06_00440 [Clavibacter michiganensis subsp. michiganensis]OUE01070.1 hypothetical protein CMMCAS08_15530 [Clavibacter michiganensis subsp. michiganensis]